MGLVFSVWGLLWTVHGLGFRVQGVGCRVQGSWWNILKGFMDIYLEAKAKIWP